MTDFPRVADLISAPGRASRTLTARPHDTPLEPGQGAARSFRGVATPRV